VSTWRRPRRRTSRLSLLYFVLLSGGLVGGSVWLDRKGEPVTATVGDKLEEVHVQSTPQGEWLRWYRLGVSFPTRDGAAGMATVTVPEARFDSLHAGDAVAIRYLSAFPLLARTANRSTLQVLRETGSAFLADPFLTPFLLWLAIGGTALWIMARIALPAMFTLGIAWLVLAFPMLFPHPASIRLGPAETSARVVAVRLITKAPERRLAGRHGGRGRGVDIRQLAMPYQVVQLRLRVPGRPDSVLAVDAVDSASAPGLSMGAMLPVRYDPRAPREARLAVATRTFREGNRYHFRVPVIGLGVLVMLAVWGSRAANKRRRAA
jgi:hypothetical protein